VNSSAASDTKRLVAMLLIIGTITSIFLFIATTEYTLLRGEMSLVQAKLVLAVTNQVGDGSVFAYATSMILWTILLGLVAGYIWSKILFPSLPFIEKFAASLALGTFIMPMNFITLTSTLSAINLFAEKTGSPPPAYFGDMMNKVIFLFSHNQEQGYELFNVSIFILIGLLILGIRLIREGQKDRARALSPQ
jgi:hypothetical protein